jgi:hypothetical protein
VEQQFFGSIYCGFPTGFALIFSGVWLYSVDIYPTSYAEPRVIERALLPIYCIHDAV